MHSILNSSKFHIHIYIHIIPSLQIRTLPITNLFIYSPIFHILLWNIYGAYPQQPPLSALSPLDLDTVNDTNSSPIVGCMPTVDIKSL